MESLYRKYRPLTFESVVGQQHIVSTLEHAITEGRLSHAYLFCGPRGTGKTTMARIVAKSLLCERADAARAEGASGCMPDGTCEECRRIAEGTHPDVYELDAASRTGVDNVREEIINSVSFAPVRGAYKIYIVDEVHMLTTQAFNALLKTLEEPPEHVVFVLCTTDPQKIPETILSRCQRFDFHRIGNEDIVGRLSYICEQEGFDYDAEALEIVAKHARGGMRDALSTLEQLSVFGNGAVHAADARALLGEVSGAVLSEFSRAIAARDVATLFGLVRAQVDAGEDLMELTRDLVAHVRDVYMARVAGARPELFDGGEEVAAEMAEEAGLFETADRLARVLTVLDDAALEMRAAADTRLVLEIALTRLARPESDLSLEALSERIDRLEARIASGVPAAPLGAGDVAALTGAAHRAEGASATPSQPVAAETRRPVAESAPARPSARTEDAAAPSEPARGGGGARARGSVAGAGASAPSQGAEPRRPAAERRRPSEARAGSSAPAPSAAAVAASASAPTPAVTDAGELQRKWADVVKRVTAAQPSRGALLQSSRAQSDDGSSLTVGFPAGSGFAITMLGRPDTQEIVLPQVCAVFGSRAVRYVMDGAAPKPSAPAAGTAAPAASPVAASEPPASPAPSAAAPAGSVSAPSAPEPSGSAWNDDVVPYDDAAAASYEEGELPPFDMPHGPSGASPAREAAARPSEVPSSEPAQPSAPAQPFAPAPSAPSEAGAESADVASILGNVFGEGVKLTQVDGSE